VDPVVNFSCIKFAFIPPMAG